MTARGLISYDGGLSSCDGGLFDCYTLCACVKVICLDKHSKRDRGEMVEKPLATARGLSSYDGGLSTIVGDPNTCDATWGLSICDGGLSTTVGGLSTCDGTLSTTC